MDNWRSAEDFSELIGQYILKAPLARALSEIGDRWLLLILLSSLSGVNNFESWRTLLGISPSVLSNRLETLVTAGFFRKRRVGNSEKRVEYTLQDKALGLMSWAIAVLDWERNWVLADRTRSIRMYHTHCGKEFRPQFLCLNCGFAVRYDDIDWRMVQGFMARPSAVPKSSRRPPNLAAAIEDKSDAFVAQTVDIIGDRWTYMILSVVVLGARRFDEFERCLGIAPNVLTDRLKRLMEHGMLAQNRYAPGKGRFEYIFTEKSRAFFAVLFSLTLWSEEYLYSPAEPDTVIRDHKLGGHTLKPALCCDQCGTVIEISDVKIEGLIQ